ncbi:chaperone NapD [Reinekea marinisedimentorum]|uniref:Nitrate reductase NapD n=1 Tax=Reinekea marinisedimentorum TaxID=230495 RepID=A0A4R3I3I5_9GAMM|nr:chaperone NapD [Reinekea marinisedimentorum]TCS40134.1 nitrate reductase NapD [Reinekea marinisedimentorum]
MRNAASVNVDPREEHIVSVVVHLNNELAGSACRAIAQLERVEMVVQQACKCVLLLNERSAREVMAKIETVQDITGVLNVAMIAHHTELPAALDEALDD